MEYQEVQGYPCSVKTQLPSGWQICKCFSCKYHHYKKPQMWACGPHVWGVFLCIRRLRRKIPSCRIFHFIMHFSLFLSRVKIENTWEFCFMWIKTASCLADRLNSCFPPLLLLLLSSTNLNYCPRTCHPALQAADYGVKHFTNHELNKAFLP